MCEFAPTLMMLEVLTIGQRNLCSTLSLPVDVIVTMDYTAGDTGDETCAKAGKKLCCDRLCFCQNKVVLSMLSIYRELLISVML